MTGGRSRKYTYMYHIILSFCIFFLGGVSLEIGKMLKRLTEEKLAKLKEEELLKQAKAMAEEEMQAGITSGTNYFTSFLSFWIYVIGKSFSCLFLNYSGSNY